MQYIRSGAGYTTAYNQLCRGTTLAVPGNHHDLRCFRGPKCATGLAIQAIFSVVPRPVPCLSIRVPWSPNIWDARMTHAMFAISDNVVNGLRGCASETLSVFSIHGCRGKYFMNGANRKFSTVNDPNSGL